MKYPVTFAPETDFIQFKNSNGFVPFLQHNVSIPKP